MESAPVTTETTDPSFRPTVHSWWQWPTVVERIIAGDPRGSEELYEILRTGFYSRFWCQLAPQDIEDHLSDVWLIVFKAVRAGEIREPERLGGFVATVVRRVIAQQIERFVRDRQRLAEVPDWDFIRDSTQPDPETSLAGREEREIARRALRGLKPSERELLERFYLCGESAAQIQTEMHLTENQYRTDKHMAKRRFGQLGRALLTARRAA